MKIVLASKSTARQAMLRNAGVQFTAISAGVDEAQAKAGLLPQKLTSVELARALAEAKANSIPNDGPGSIVIGCDQTLEMDDGTTLDKPANLSALAEQLTLLSGRVHRLHSAVICCENGRPVWDACETVVLKMRPLSEMFIGNYIASSDNSLLGCVGGYQIEGQGAQLFEKIEGSYFAILGLPLLPLLGFLRQRGLLMT